MISSQRLRPLDHEARYTIIKLNINMTLWNCSISTKTSAEERCINEEPKGDVALTNKTKILKSAPADQIVIFALSAPEGWR
jgi:hypothetical protein